MSPTSRHPRTSRPLATSVPAEKLRASIHAMVLPVLNVPEAERTAWYRSMERYARDNHPLGFYADNKLAAAWLRVAAVCWPTWPEQEPETCAEHSAQTGRDESRAWIPEPPDRGTLSPWSGGGGPT